MNFSSVVSLHTNPMTCGVAKFGSQLAQRLNVPFVGLNDPGRWGDFPLWSLKWSEVVESKTPPVPWPSRFGIFWHDAGHEAITRRAEHVFYADPSLGSPGLWCPSLIAPRRRPVRLFSFGMAGRLQPEKYRRVRELLDAASIRYHLRVSVGIHEGTSLDGAEKHFDALKAIMGPEHVTILGILSDDAVSEELANADYVLAFFEKGLRANNTTVHAALEAGRRVVTNCDEHTPTLLKWDVVDVELMDAWPRRNAEFGWDQLLTEMKGVCDHSKSTAAR